MSTAVAQPGAGAPPAVLEAPDHRRARLSTGTLVLILGAGLVLLGLFASHGVARFAFLDPFQFPDAKPLPVPGGITAVACGVLCLAAGAVYVWGKLPRAVSIVAAVVAGLAVVLGFVAWAAAGSQLPFPVGNQLTGTLAMATPLVFGALCGVLCERAGVVNVAIEGQMLTAAFTAATVGSVTQSLPAAMLAAIAAAVAMGALLALFSINFLVDQVVLGVVLNLFATGLTGFLFDSLIKPHSTELNNAPTLQRLAIPGLSKIPFFGDILFNQTILAYLAGLSVLVVWFVLFHTTWGLRVRSVGEHPKAADTVGISVRGMRWSGVLVGSIFAGLGGSFFTIASTGSFNKEITVGNGFIALAALIMGRWHPGLAACMALFFGFVTQLASQVQALNSPVPSQLLLLLPYLATIIAVAGLVGKVRAPKADGQPYVK